MAGFRSILTTLALGTAIISRPAIAQHGSSASLTHVVTVTVPPRVKVQVARVATSVATASVATAVAVSANKGAVQGLALSVSATRDWVLSIGSSAASPRSHVQWSHNGNSGFSTVTNGQVNVASGTLSSDPRAATLFFRNTSVAAQSVSGQAGDGEPVILTVSAP